MTILEMAAVLRDTTFAAYLRGDVAGTEWIFPIVETLHVVCLAIVFGSVVMVDLRLLGVASRQMPFRRLYREVIPWTWWGFVGAAFFGSILAMGLIDRYIANPQFIAKFALLAAAGLNMLVFHFGVFRGVERWDEASPPFAARAAGALSIACWTGVVVCGRWIGFTI